MKGASDYGFHGASEPGIRISAFPTIGDYAFLSDCETTALVAPNGNVEWLCLPRMDSPSVFAAMLDRDAGSFRLGPADVSVPAGRRYIPGTMVLETSWETRMGWVIVRDALSAGPGYNEALAKSEGIDLSLRLITDLRLGFEGPRARARTTLHEGEVAFVAL